MIVDRCKEFLAKLNTMIANDCRILQTPISARLPQTNIIMEWVHQTIGNIACTFKTQHMDLEDEIPWEGILSHTMFTICFKVHTTIQLTPS